MSKAPYIPQKAPPAFKMNIEALKNENTRFPYKNIIAHISETEPVQVLVKSIPMIQLIPWHFTVTFTSGTPEADATAEIVINELKQLIIASREYEATKFTLIQKIGNSVLTYSLTDAIISSVEISKLQKPDPFGVETHIWHFSVSYKFATLDIS